LILTYYVKKLELRVKPLVAVLSQVQFITFMYFAIYDCTGTFCKKNTVNVLASVSPTQLDKVLN